MEWHVGTSAHELVVPKEESDLHWMEWGINAPESFWLPQKQFVAETKRVEELNFIGKTLSNEVDTDMLTNGRDMPSSSSLCEDSLEAFDHSAMLQCDWPDHPLEDLKGINEMDDIFMSSLLEDLPIAEDQHGSFSFPLEPTNTTSDDHLTNTVFDSQIEPTNAASNGMNNSKHFKSQAFFPSVNWGYEQFTFSDFIPFNSTQNNSSFSKSQENIMVSSEQSRETNRTVGETSMEELVLQELRTIMEQMSNKTRMCFRDSLYRLAENSKHFNTNQKQQDFVTERNSLQSVFNEDTRPDVTEDFESETNKLDRAIANLMFNKMTPVTESDGSELGNIPSYQPYDYNSNQLKMSQFHDMFPGDAEVPKFGSRIDFA